MPFADERRPVPDPLEQRGQGGMFGRQADSRVGRCQRLFQPQREPVLIAARDQRQARRGADRGVRVRLQKTDAVGGDAIDVRRVEIGTSVARDVGVPEIVRHDEDDVRPRCGLTEHVFEARRQSERAERRAAQHAAAAHVVRWHGGIMHHTKRRSQP